MIKVVLETLRYRLFVILGIERNPPAPPKDKSNIGF